MIGTLYSFVYDCPDPQELAEFYQRIVGGEIESDSDGWVYLVYPGDAARLGFQHAPGFQAPNWPDEEGDLQAHLDVLVEDVDRAHEELIALGARLAQEHDSFRVYLDPVGHPFCIFS